MFTFFTEVVKKDVVDRHDRYLGHPHDFTARLEEVYPSITSLIVARGVFRKAYYVIPWKEVHRTEKVFQLRVPLESLVPQRTYRKPGEATLRTAVMDQQVVDTFNRKIVRVNDIHFLVVDDDLRLAHVDCGLRGLVRRLGWERTVDALVRAFHQHANYLRDTGFISWKYVQPLSIQEATGKIQLSVEMDELRQIPPEDISTMLMDLDPYQRAALVKTMDVGRQVEVITELGFKWQKELIEVLDAQTAVALFERMPADEATDLLAELSKRDANRILSMLSTKKAREITELLEHESDSAGGLMTKEFILLSEGMTVGEAIEYIRSSGVRKAETIYKGFVVDEEGKLIGAVTFRRLLLEPLDAKIRKVMQRKPPAVNVADSVKDVAYAMDKYNLFALPVVGDKGVLEGMITVDDVLHVAVEEAWGKRSGL